MEKRIAALVLFLSLTSLFLSHPFQVLGEKPHDPCDSYGDCVAGSVKYVRSNPDDSLYLGDQLSVTTTTTTGSGSSSGTTWVGSFEGVNWSYDPVIFSATIGGQTASFIIKENVTGDYTITATATFLVSVTTCTTSSTGQATCSTSYAQTSVPVSEQVSLRTFVLTFQTELVNVTGTDGFTLRNEDGTFYRNDSFCDSWNATFLFASERIDIKVNITSITPSSLSVRNYSAGALGRTGRFCYSVRTNSTYGPFNAVLKATALNWQEAVLGMRESAQPFAVVQYDPAFTSYSYMLYRNSTAPSSLERPWVLFVRYDGNDPGYSYAGDSNTRSFNGSRTLQERAYFGNFTFTSLSYRPFNSSGVFEFRAVNSTDSLRYSWLNENKSAPLEGGRRIEKYVFAVSPSSLVPLLSQGYIYQNVTMIGRWTHESNFSLKKNYWLVPFLWSGRVNIVSVDSRGNLMPNTPLSVTIRNPSPLSQWLVGNFERVFGNDSHALKAFEKDLYPTNQTMTFNGTGILTLLLNQTSLVPPQISITAEGLSLSGNFTFVPVFVNTTIISAPNSFNGTVFYANATIPLWSYNMVQSSLAFMPVTTTINQPTTFLELVNSSSEWVAGNTTPPQTPSAFASQDYGFWPMGENLTAYANQQGGGVDLLGVQKVGPSEYQASFDIEPWSGGIASVQLTESSAVIETEPSLNTEAYPSPLPQGLVGPFSITYPGTGQDVRAVFTNVWGEKTTIDLGAATASQPPTNLIPETTVAAFGMAGIAWLIVSGVLKTRRAIVHE